jgi:5-methylcytosine-specific restriction endonuclease McrA
VDAPCHYCGTPGRIHWHIHASGKPSAWVSFTDLEMDHVTPESRGGSHEPDNLVLACRRCNRSKGWR